MTRREFEAVCRKLGVTAEIERPRRDEVSIVIDAPTGQRFSGSATHILTTHFYSDASAGFDEAHRDLIANLPLEPCDDSCEEHD